jgi:large subunit ribosomal protein L21
MYAIVKTGGKQYRVEKGQTLLVERLPAAEGDTVTLQPMLFRSDETVFDKDGLEKVKIEAKIVSHERGPKLRVFKFKPKRGYKRRTGHRQELTRIEVTDLKLLTRRPAAKMADGADDKPAAETKVATKPPAAETKAAATPAPAKPKPAKEEDDGS